MPRAIGRRHGCNLHAWGPWNPTQSTETGSNGIRLSTQSKRVMQLPGPMYPLCMHVCGLRGCEMVCFFVVLFYWIWVRKENSHFCFIREGDGILLIIDTKGRSNFLVDAPLCHTLLDAHCWGKWLALSFLLCLLTIFCHYCTLLHQPLSFPASSFSFLWLVFLILPIKGIAITIISLLTCAFQWLPFIYKGEKNS